MIQLKSFIAYQGPKFTIEWYYTKEGKIPALDYFKTLDKHEKAQAFRLFELMASEGKILNIQKFRHEGYGIYAFKPKPHRFLCFFFERQKIIITNGFEKKRDDLPLNEKERAMKYQKDYEVRIKEGKYYD